MLGCFEAVPLVSLEHERDTRAYIEPAMIKAP
jgi:hypothetical protein